MNRLEKAAAFGRMMGKRAIALSPTVLSSLAGAAVGGGGTAIYDWLKGTKENKLRRAMIGAGVGGLTGAGIGHLASKLIPASKPLGNKPKSPKSDDTSSDFVYPTEAEMDDYYRETYKNYYPKEPRPIDLASMPKFEGRAFQSDMDEATAKGSRAYLEHERAKADLKREWSQKPPYYSEPHIIKAKENMASTAADIDYYRKLKNQIEMDSDFPSQRGLQKEGPFVNWLGHIKVPAGRDGGEPRTIGKVTYKFGD